MAEEKDTLPATIDSVGTADLILSPNAMQSMERAATMMAAARIMMPQHLRNSPGDCLGVLMQAAQWRMNPYALAQKTFVVNGVIGYEAQAMKAAIDTNSKLEGGLRFEYFGDWDAVLGKIEWKKNAKQQEYATPGWSHEDERGVGVHCSGHVRGEAEPRILRLELRQCHPRNSTLWGTDPRQQIAYLASKRWARLHLPSVLLGVYDAEEVREINVTQAAPLTVEDLMVAPAEENSKPVKGVESELTKQQTLDQEALLGEVRQAIKECETLATLRDVGLQQTGDLVGVWADEAREAYADRMTEIKGAEVADG